MPRLPRSDLRFCEVIESLRAEISLRSREFSLSRSTPSLSEPPRPKPASALSDECGRPELDDMLLVVRLLLLAELPALLPATKKKGTVRQKKTDRGAIGRVQDRLNRIFGQQKAVAHSNIGGDRGIDGQRLNGRIGEADEGGRLGSLGTATEV